MKHLEKIKAGLDLKFKEVLETPASFTLFTAVHDFIEYIEKYPVLSGGLSLRLKINQESSIENKYGYLKQIHQGVKDINDTSGADLGHARYLAIRDLQRIQSNDVSESNLFWKKRELMKRSASEVYQRLTMHLSHSKAGE